MVGLKIYGRLDCIFHVMETSDFLMQNDNIIAVCQRIYGRHLGNLNFSQILGMTLY